MRWLAGTAEVWHRVSPCCGTVRFQCGYAASRLMTGSRLLKISSSAPGIGEQLQITLARLPNSATIAQHFRFHIIADDIVHGITDWADSACGNVNTKHGRKFSSTIYRLLRCDKQLAWIERIAAPSHQLNKRGGLVIHQLLSALSR